MRALLQKRLLASADSSLAIQRADGGLEHNFNLMMILTWAVCYTENFSGNRHYQNPKALDAIARLGDYNADCLDAHGLFQNNECSMGGWDEWRYLAWLEAFVRVRDRLDDKRITAWTQKFIGSGNHFMPMCVDMDTFDGGIPNHGTWSHVYIYRVGQVFKIADYMSVTGEALQRIIASQTPDGCWREGQSAGGFQGTHVTLYNLTTASAISVHHHHTGDKAAAASLERAWHWYYDFLLPDISMPPTLDARTKYSAGPSAPHLPGYFYNIPQGLYCADQHWGLYDKIFATKPATEHWHAHRMIGFDALQYDQMRETTPEKPAWPEYQRMIAEEACIRRRPGWTVLLSGMTNLNTSNIGTRLFMQERQDAVNIYHDKLGLIIGSCHSRMDVDLSTFVVFDTGKAHYLPDGAYLKSTPPRDSLLLRYGSNVATVSLDTRKPDEVAVEFSLHGERGRATRRAPGHALSAMGARGHLSLRLSPGATFTHNAKMRTLPQDESSAVHLRVAAGEEVDFGTWKIGCDKPWVFRWPLRPSDPYTLETPLEWIGGAQVMLYPTNFSHGGATESAGRPTAVFLVRVR
jgi:hypothetical protein